MSGSIFLLQNGSNLVRMNASLYDSEVLLQELLAKYPDLLAGDQFDSTEPRRWLLVSREMAVPGEEAGAGRWSLDHLFLDQDAIPTLVEVKRSTDTRIRREVVGQMLDYAANGVAYWPVEAIRSQFEKTCENRGLHPSKEIGAFLGEQADQQAFWQMVKTNLQAGRICMVFVADEIPAELRRVVEFLNGQMDPAEVFAIEIKQYVGQGMKTLVPRVIGQTAEAERKKSPGQRTERQWDETTFFSVLDSRPEENLAGDARRIYEWGQKAGLRVRWSRGQNGAFYLVLNHSNRDYFPIAIRTGFTNAYVEFQFGRLKDAPPFNNPAKRSELLRRLNDIPGVSISEEQSTKYPGVPLAVLSKDGVLRKFIETLDWVLTEIKTT